MKIFLVATSLCIVVVVTTCEKTPSSNESTPEPYGAIIKGRFLTCAELPKAYRKALREHERLISGSDAIPQIDPTENSMASCSEIAGRLKEVLDENAQLQQLPDPTKTETEEERKERCKLIDKDLTDMKNAGKITEAGFEAMKISANCYENGD